MKLFHKKVGKKAMLDDLFDFLFTVMIGFFLFFFLTSIVDKSIGEGKKETIHSLAEFKLGENNLQKLRMMLDEGQTISYGQVDDLIPKGLSFRSCSDYQNKDDCVADVLNNAREEYFCAWNEDLKKCAAEGVSLPP